MRLLDRIVLGALAGVAATLPMTIAMRHLHNRLPADERYPLPPREISKDFPRLGLRPATATLLYHFAYGGAAGAVFALFSRRRGLTTGGLFGVGVWGASYLGWIPLARVLRPGTDHPARRNALMLAVHLVWGGGLAAGLRELELARAESFACGNSPSPVLKDRPEDRP